MAAPNIYDLCGSGIPSGIPVYDGLQTANDSATGFVRRRINFKKFLLNANLIASLAAAKTTPLATALYGGDTLAIMPVKIGYFVNNVAAAIIQADSKGDFNATVGDITGTTVTVSIGDDQAPTSFIASLDIAQAAGTIASSSSSKLMAAANTALVVKLISTGVIGANPMRPRDGIIEVAGTVADVFPGLRANPNLASGLASLQTN